MLVWIPEFHDENLSRDFQIFSVLCYETGIFTDTMNMCFLVKKKKEVEMMMVSSF